MIRASDCTLIRTILLLSAALPLQLFSQQGKNDCNINAPRNGIYVIAHRGAHIGIPENSLAAYQKAIDLGCDFVEIKVITDEKEGTIEEWTRIIDLKTDGIQTDKPEELITLLKSLK